MATSLIEHLDSFDYNFKDDNERSNAVRAAQQFLAKAQTPFERLSTYCNALPSLIAVLKIFVDLDIFSKWQKTGQKQIDSKQLADISGLDPVLAGRFLRHLATNNIVDDVGPDSFEQTVTSLAMIQPGYACWPQYYFDAMAPANLNLPSHLKASNYKNPEEPKSVSFLEAKKSEDVDLFGYYATHPDEAKIFNDCMTGYTAARTNWTTFYPTERLIDGSDSDQTLLVDVGGNRGQQIEEFRKKHPDQAARLVLQDLPSVVKDSICSAPVRVEAHDFFTPQPVKGARAYFMATVLHDWSDTYARKMLQNIRDAMKPGYSKLLINDIVLPATGLAPMMTMADMVMLVKVGSQERTEAMWRDLTQSAGLQVERVWSGAGNVASIIECVAV